MKQFLNLSKITGSIKNFQSSLFSSKKTTLNMQKLLFKKTKVKKSTIQGKKNFFDRRREYKRRQESEAALEARELITSPVKAIGRATGGFLSRILKFLGTLLLGWLVNNIPTIIAMAKELIARIQRMYELLKGFIGNIFNIMKNFGSLLSAVFQNIISLDFLDSSNRVKNAWSDLEKNFDDMGKQLDEGIRLATTSLGESIAPGGPGEIPATGTDYTMPPGEEVNPSDLGPATDLKSGARAFLNAGFPAKGAAYLAGNVQQESGWRGQRSPWVLNDGAGTNKGLMSWNRGRIVNAEKFLGKPLNQASNAEQIKWIKHEMKTYYPSAYKVFMNPNATDAELQSASYTYLGYGDVGARFKYAQVALKDLESSGVNLKAPGQVVSPYPSGPSGPIPNQGSLPPLPPTNTLPGKQHYGAPRDDNGDGKPDRKHAGVDFDISGNTQFYSRIGGVVTGSPFRYGADGWAIDVYNKQLGVYERIAEAQRILVKQGQTVQPGQAVVQGESNTGVIHYEIRKTVQGGFENTVDPIKFLQSSKPSANSQQERQSQSTPSAAPTTKPATTTSTSTTPMIETPTQTSPSQEQLTPEISSVPALTETYKDVQYPTAPQQQTIFIDDTQPPQQVPVPSGGSSGSSGQIPTMGKNTLLNRFMRNHLLLDLAYT